MRRLNFGSLSIKKDKKLFVVRTKFSPAHFDFVRRISVTKVQGVFELGWDNVFSVELKKYHRQLFVLRDKVQSQAFRVHSASVDYSVYRVNNIYLAGIPFIAFAFQQGN